MYKIVFVVVYFSFFMACSQNNSIDIENLFKVANVEQTFTSKSIEFVKEDVNNIPNYSFGLYGEKIDSSITNIYKIHYTIDWEKENAFPNLFYKEIPLKAPNILTNKNGSPIIITAEIGNDKPFDVRDLDVFDNDQVMKLKETLTSIYGNPVEDNPIESNIIWRSYLGNIYIWKDNNFLIRLSINNECFCKRAQGYSPEKYKEHPKGGRYGQLVIYKNIKPKFYLND